MQNSGDHKLAELIDTHCHLDVEAFDLDRREVIAAACATGVAAVVVPGIEAGGWRGLLDLCGSEPHLYPALGLHPVFLGRHRDVHLEELELLIDKVRPVAVGEIGLDFFRRDLDRDRQQVLFEAQLELSAVARLPVLIHARKSHDQVLAALKRIRVPGGIAHAFSGSLQQAHKYIDLGFKLGFGGMLTFERSRKLRTLARDLPLEAIVLETDAPDLTVSAHQGERNSPEYLPDVLAALAQVRGEAADLVAAQTTRNARELLGLKAQ
jgi:TatD DNase family protein